jgi:hypothetical protein
LELSDLITRAKSVAERLPRPRRKDEARALEDAAAVVGKPSLLDAVKSIFATLFRVAGTAIAVTAAITAGVYTSRSMVANGSPFSTATFGPWMHWVNTGRPGADPYTRAHMARSSTLRLAADSAGVYEATVDAQGARLHSSCDYAVEGPGFGTLWWSVAVFDGSGSLIRNDAERYTFTSDTIALNPDGSYLVTLGRDARPGNWLPTSGAGRLTLVLTVLDPATGLSDEERAERAKLLPVIRKEGCS